MKKPMNSVISSRWPHKKGFSLAELLLTVGIMGVLAAFTIPKVFTSPQSISYRQTEATKNVAFMILSAYQQYRAVNQSIPSTFMAPDLLPYLNYVSRYTATKELDAHANVGASTWSKCAGTTASQDGICLQLHNGGALWLDTRFRIGGSTTQDAVFFRFDPNATYEGPVTDAPGMGIQLVLYCDGTIRSRATMRPNTRYIRVTDSMVFTMTAVGNEDPSWFTGL